MKLIGKMITIAGMAAAISSCGSTETTTDNAAENKEFKYLVDEFADLKIMRYQVPGWEELTLKQKEYVYHLAEAAKYGRDIIWVQNCKYNLQIRKTLENILENYRETARLRIGLSLRHMQKECSSATESTITMPRTNSSLSAPRIISMT